MENGSNTMFRASGRFTFGNSAVGSMGGTFVVGIDGGHTSDVDIKKDYNT